MQRLVDTLSTLPPLLLIGGLTLLMTLETVFPYFQHGAGRRRQRWCNVGMIAIAMHKVPALWRIHRVHHADTELDASSAVRLHPFELVYLLGTLAVALSLLGVPVVSYLIYATITLPWFLLNHSNMKYPHWFECWGSWLMSTPNWHRVHHSSLRPETDSHYGCVFSIWDRVFGTTRKTHVESIRFGLERYREPGDQTVWALLRMPFGPL